MRIGVLLGVVAAGNMLFWFLFQGYVLSASDASQEADAFFGSFALPQMILLITNSSLMHVLVPFFADERDDLVRRDAYALLTALTLLLVPLSAALYVTASIWMPVFVAGLPVPAQDLAVEMARVQLFGLTLFAWNGVLASACHARKQFLRAETAPLLATLLAFAGLVYAYPIYGVKAAAWLMTARSVAVVAFLLPTLGRPVFSGWGRVRVVWDQIKPLLLSSTYYKSDQLLDRFLSSLGRVGDISTFYFAQQIHLAGHGVLGKALIAPCVPVLAAHAKQGRWEEFLGLYRKNLIRTVLTASVCWAAIGLAAIPSIALVAALTGVPEPAVARTAWLWILLGGLLVGGLGGWVLVETYFAMGDSRTPSIALAAGFTVGIGLKVAGFRLGATEGLAVATSVFCFVTPAALLFMLERRVRARGCGERSGLPGGNPIAVQERSGEAVTMRAGGHGMDHG